MSNIRRRRARLLNQVRCVAPSLRQTCWPPMTYMGIPSLLGQADSLISSLESYPERDAELDAALELMQRLRREFHRDK